VIGESVALSTMTFEAQDLRKINIPRQSSTRSRFRKAETAFGGTSNGMETKSNRSLDGYTFRQWTAKCWKHSILEVCLSK
jgi:hypothetical protein